jgi:hypothetical protein
MKRFLFFLVLFLVLTASNVFSHESGDLLLNIEPQLGAVMPSDTLKDNNMGVGFGLSLRLTADYYFLDYLAFNAGVGIGASHHSFSKSDGEEKKYGLLMIPLFGWIILAANPPGHNESEVHGEYFPIYITIPFGLRYSIDIFTIGAGATANFPVLPGGEDYNSYGYWAIDSKRKDENVTFKLLPYMGWYFDFGFDFPNKKREQNAFGILLRLNGSFQKAIAEVYDNSEKQIPVNDFNFFSVDLLFRFSIGLANIPISGKK